MVASRIDLPRETIARRCGVDFADRVSRLHPVLRAAAVARQIARLDVDQRIVPSRVALIDNRGVVLQIN